MRKFFILISFVLCCSSDMFGAIYKGHRMYVKVCAKCHTDKDGFVKSKTKAQWASLMQTRGKKLKELHISNKKAKQSWKFFNNSKYPSKSRHLREFLLEYAKDSEKVPAFN